jgi:hypothetical protein
MLIVEMLFKYDIHYMQTAKTKILTIQMDI